MDSKIGKCINCLQPTHHLYVCSKVCAEMYMEAMSKSSMWSFSLKDLPLIPSTDIDQSNTPDRLSK